jgi:hypothetical protein
VRVVGEDVEDHGRPIDHRHPEVSLEVALLAWGELVVGSHEVRVGSRDLAPELGELAAAEVAVGVRRRPHLDHLAGGGDARSAEQFLELGQRIPVGRRGFGDADRKGTLPRPRVLDPGVPGAAGLGQAAVSGSLHLRRL